MVRDYDKYKNFNIELKNYNKFNGKAFISIDFSDNEIITDILNKREYNSDSIITVCFKDWLFDKTYLHRNTLYDLLEAMSEKYKEGWTKEDFEMYGTSEFARFFI